MGERPGAQHYHHNNRNGRQHHYENNHGNKSTNYPRGGGSSSNRSRGYYRGGRGAYRGSRQPQAPFYNTLFKRDFKHNPKYYNYLIFGTHL